MLAIVAFENGKPTGWIIGTDVDDARRQAQAAGRMDVAEMLYRAPFPLNAGRHDLGDGTWLLVS